MSLSKKQFIRNSVWTFLELVLYPLMMIIATPIFIKNLGIEQYGLWMLVNTITLGIHVLNIGVGDTNIRLISRYRAENSPDHITRVFNFNFSFSLFLCFLACLVGLLFYYFNFIAVFYKTRDYSFANTILLLACITTGLKFIEIALLSVFKAFERFDISSKLVLVSKNSVMLLNVFLVIFHFDLVSIFFYSVILTALNIIVQILTLRRFQPKLFKAPSFIFFREKLDYLNYNFWYWLQSVVALLGFLADKLVIAYFTDVRTLGYYSIASLIGSNIHNFFLAFGSFIFPRVSFKLSENKEVSRLYFIARSLIALPGWALITSLILFGDFIFRLWLGNETFLNSIIYIRLYLVFEAGMLLIIVPFYFINGSKLVRLNSLFEIVIRSSHFIGMLVGYYFYGVLGILYGMIISTLLNIPFQYYFFHRRIVDGTSKLQFIWVIFPVIFLLGLIAGNVFFQLSSIICLLVCCKLIYFDPAREYSKGIFALPGLFGRT